MEYYSAIKRNKTGSFVEMWMDLESIIQSEVSRKEKNKFMDAKRRNRGGMNLEIGIDIYTLIHIQ